MEYNILHEWNFGDDRKLAEELKQLVLSGKKTATTGLFLDGKKVPSVGDYAAMVDSNGNRFCVIQYTNIAVKPFLEVGYDFIQKEGEGDKNVEEWREKHRKFFNLKNSDVSVVCEEFKLILENV